MKNILLFAFFIVSTFLYSQDEKQRFEQTQTKELVSNAAYNNALNEMQSSADKSTKEKIKQVDEQFELNFSKKAKYETRLKLLLQKKTDANEKLMRAKSDAEKEKFKEKISELHVDIDKLKKKLVENEVELKTLQNFYNKLKK
ncbi:hypothetical protein QGN23_04700 [Chryseobacterium gotjawalense]|uniref:Uncharacterized protein n=1 Tax=Chryseobacterium gotjawalense TaxID=3042315 RepID=A0ABY8RFU7_9FLAO|nr:hypothetical protein [Chryseobacterium sp. wdc7]WHF52579.1 hypothetical protein QGN23_04700 [Chryseobacterium sp. wdc7]